jgi:hypothetical protein
VSEEMKRFKDIKDSVALLLLVLFGLVLTAGCTSTFLVTKDGEGYFFGGKRDKLYRMLCDSGDLKKILGDTGLAEDVKDNLYRYNCLERSGERIKEIYASLTVEGRKDLRRSFKRHGYDINYIPC